MESYPGVVLSKITYGLFSDTSLASSSEPGLERRKGFQECTSVSTSVDYAHGSYANPEQSVERARSP